MFGITGSSKRWSYSSSSASKELCFVGHLYFSLSIWKCFEQRWFLCAGICVLWDVSFQTLLFRSCNPCSCSDNDRTALLACSESQWWWKTSNWFKIAKNCQRGVCFETLMGFVPSHLSPITLESWRHKVPADCFPVLSCVPCAPEVEGDSEQTALFTCGTKKYLVGVVGSYFSP